MRSREYYLRKFKNLKQQNRWNAMTPEQEQIQALEAQVKGLKQTARRAGGTKVYEKRRGAGTQKGKDFKDEKKGKKDE